MKLVLCGNCSDVFAPNANVRSCACTKTWAYISEDYTLHLSASEFAKVIELDTRGIVNALNLSLIGTDSEIPAYMIAGEAEGVNRCHVQ